MNTTYNTGKLSWQHGEKMVGHNEHHLLLGPCPYCGSPTFNYGGGWRCLSVECFNGASNTFSNLGPRPSWWNKGIQVFKDGDAWCATTNEFLNLQESVAGFGTTPNDAVSDLIINQNK